MSRRDVALTIFAGIAALSVTAFAVWAVLSWEW